MTGPHVPDVERAPTAPEDSPARLTTGKLPQAGAAERALAEAAQRRAAAALARERPREQGGRGGLEPVRYGDWEVKGIASDF